mgnify:CR=1 FL=1
MKKLHSSDLYCWSEFNEERNIDFNGTLWVNSLGNVLIDPVRLEEHDKNHLDSLGGAAHIIITNSDHVRDTEIISSLTGAKCWGPSEEKDGFPFECDAWLKEGDEPINGIKIYSLNGSKTKGELAILIESKTLVTGDLIRAHEGGKLCMLPDEKLKDRKLALESVKRMASIKDIIAVIPGDGWPIFKYGHDALLELSEKL